KNYKEQQRVLLDAEEQQRAEARKSMSPVEQALDELGWVFHRGVREGGIRVKPFPVYDEEEHAQQEETKGKKSVRQDAVFLSQAKCQFLVCLVLCPTRWSNFMALIFPGKTRCGICDKVIGEDDAIVAFPAFLRPNHPLWKYSDGAFHERCFNESPDRQAVER